ncbi:MAG: LPS assembly lipoprotein LptE [Kiritimatiellales bacterium]
MKFAKPFLFSVIALMLSGCAGYRVGSTLDPSIKTVSLSVINKTDEPSIEVAVMKALRAELQMDGRLEVRSQDVADAVLTVTLTRFNLESLAYNRQQGSLAEEYRMTMAGSAVLSKAETDEVVLENPRVEGEAEFPYMADLTTAKRAAMPGAAGDLARKVVSTLVTAW